MHGVHVHTPQGGKKNGGGFTGEVVSAPQAEEELRDQEGGSG